MEKRPYQYLINHSIQETRFMEDEQFIAALKAIIHANLSKKSFNIISLANQLFISERQLNRKTKRIAGITIGNFIRETKLNEAQRMLQKGSYGTVAEISHIIGYQKPGHFSKIYTDRFGKRPVEYFNHTKK